MVSVMPLFFGLFVVAMIVLIVFGALQARRRREESKAFATRHGLRFSTEHVRGIDTDFPNFKCFARGSNRYATNLLEGEWRGRPMRAFDFHYETSSTDGKGKRQTSHHWFTAVIFTSELRLKPLHIRPETVFDKLGSFFGMEDINFESAEFSRQFHVTAPDRRWAYDVLHARAIEHLLARPRCSMAFDTRHAVVWRERTLKPEQIGEAADLFCDLIEMLPDYVVHQQRQEASTWS